MNPTVIRSVAVTTADVVAALETNETTSNRAVLRMLPPYAGRMRARLHLLNGSTEKLVRDSADGAIGDVPTSDEPDGVLYLDPKTLAPDAPAYPRPGETAAELRNDPTETYSVERHHEYHAKAIAQWREELPEHIADTVTIETQHGDHEIRVRSLYKEF